MKEWYRTPYKNDNDFNIKSKYNEYKQLVCNDSRVSGIAESTSFEYWILPDLTILEDGDSVLFPTLDGIAYWNVTNNGFILNIGLVQERHFGFYHCVVKVGNDGKKIIVKKALNYHGAYFGNLWSTYKKNTMIGGIAGGSMALILIVCSIIYTLKFEDKDNEIQPDNDTGSIKEETNNASYTNEGYEVTVM
ncbi:unnamed protein product [Dimorphilus gyrociliatus]|uniref:Uncharacterized protein n=1 Tax=Dimorphilus gyrociliatus TaxID=2664684 RepID=A0A7I8VGK2_9ANNE|nr:unnamed protein product [Dimorphilus gyrociliatus]